MTLISYTVLVEGVPTDADSVVFSDPTGTFGLRRTDTQAVLVADGVALTRASQGVYTYNLTDPESGLVYEYWIEVSYDGDTYRSQQFATGDVGPEDVKRLEFVVVKDGAPVTLAQVPKLSSPNGAYGVARQDTAEVIVADGTAMTLVGSTLYRYFFDDPEHLVYRYYIEAVVDGVTYHLPRTTALVSSAALVFGRYTDSTKIEAQFGVENVHKWLGIDDTDEAVDYALRMYALIAAAESQIDDLLRRSTLTVPFTTTIPSVVSDVATALAGVRMYESRGVTDFNPETGVPQHRLHYQKKEAEKKLAIMCTGQLRVAGDEGVRYPAIVEDE